MSKKKIAEDPQPDIPTISSIEEYIAWVKELGNGEFIFRGQANAEWPLRSGAARRVCGDKETDPIIYSEVLDYIHDLINLVKLKDFQQQRHLSCDLKILAELQHHGAATTMLDFSKNSLIALWMACSDQVKEDGKVFALNNQLIQSSPKIERVSNKELVPEKDYMVFFGDIETAWIWEPSHFNERIPAQASIFFLAQEPYKLNFEQVIIAHSCKAELYKQLQRMFGIEEISVYPDFVGLAKANAANKGYPRKDAQFYFQNGNRFYQLNEFEKAIADYDQAIKLEPNFAVYNNRGVAKQAMKMYEEAITDYDQAIKLKSDYANAYNNRGNVKKYIGLYPEAIEDYDQAIKLNPNFALAYNNRGVAKQAMERYGEAIADYDQAIRLSQDFALAYNNRGNMKKALGMNEEAKQDFAKAKEIEARSK